MLFEVARIGLTYHRRAPLRFVYRDLSFRVLRTMLQTLTTVETIVSIKIVSSLRQQQFLGFTLGITRVHMAAVFII